MVIVLTTKGRVTTNVGTEARDGEAVIESGGIITSLGRKEMREG